MTTNTLANLVDTVGEYKSLEDGFWSIYIDSLTGDAPFEKRKRFRQRWDENLSLRLDAAGRLLKHMQAQDLVTAHGENFTATLVAKDHYGREQEVRIEKK